MADATAKFAIDLEDNTSGSADAAAGALQRLQAKLQADTKALREMEAAMKRLQGGTTVSIDAFRSLSAQVAAKKQAIAESTTAFVQLGGSFRKLPKPANDAGNAAGSAAARMAALANVANGVNPALAGTTGRLKALVQGLGSAGVAGVAAIAVVGLLALAAAAAVVALRVARFALGAADAARSELLLAEAATRSAAGGAALAASVQRVSRQVALGQGELSSYARQLARAKIAGSDLEAALEAVGIAASVGEDAGALVRQMEQAKKTGKSIAKIAADVKGQFGGVASRQMMSFTVQVKKARESVANIFAGVKIEPFLAALQRVLGLLDSSTSSGRALRLMAETMLNPLFSGLAKGEGAATQFFKGMVIGALRVTIAVLLVRNRLREMFAGVDLAKHESKFKLLGIAALVFAAAIAAAVVGIGLIAAVIGGSFAVGAAVFGTIVAGIAALAVGIAMLAVKIATGVAAAVRALREKLGDFVSAGASFVAGLAQGITAGLSSVVAAATNVAKGAIGAVKKTLGIASPARVMFEAGGDTTDGFAGGLEAGSAKVEGASEAMAQAPIAAAGAATGGSGGGALGASQSVTLSIGEVHVHGVEGADDPAFGEKLAEAFERALVGMGLGTEAAA